MKRKTVLIIFTSCSILVLLFVFVYYPRRVKHDYSLFQKYNINQNSQENLVLACISNVTFDSIEEIYCYNTETTNYDIVNLDFYFNYEQKDLGIGFNFLSINGRELSIYKVSDEEVNFILNSWKEKFLQDDSLFITQQGGRTRIDQFNYLRLQRLKTVLVEDYEYDFQAFLFNLSDDAFLIPNPARFEDVEFFYKRNQTDLEIEDIMIFNEFIEAPYARLLEYDRLENLVDEEGNFRAYDVMFLLNMVNHSLSDEQDLYLFYLDRFDEYIKNYKLKLEYYIKEYDWFQSEDFINFLINYSPNDGTYARQYLFKEYWLESKYNVLVKYIDSVCYSDDCLKQKLNLLFLLRVAD